MMATMEQTVDVPLTARLRAPLASHLQTVYDHYLPAVQAAMEERQAQTTTPPAKRSRTRESKTAAPTTAQRTDTGGGRTAAASRADSASEGARLLALLCSYVGLDGSPRKQPLTKDYERLEHMVLRSELHADGSLSQDAFRVLMLLIGAFPGSAPSDDQPQRVLVNPLGWSMLMSGKKIADVVTSEGWNDGAGATEPVHRAFFRLCSAAQQIVEAPADGDVRLRCTGSVLLLQAVLTALQQDLNTRLAVFRSASAAAADANAAQPISRSVQVLLGNSHLWRLLQMLPSKGISIDHSRDRLLEMLLRWVAAPASDTEQHLTVATIAELGAGLLNAIMTLYEAAEATGMAIAANRSRTTADEANERAVIDKAILTYFVGPSSTLRTWAQRSAVLAALQTRHRLRILSLVAAKSRRWRQADASKFPSLHAAHRWLAGEQEWLAPIDPAEVLVELAADASVAQRFDEERDRRGCGVTAVACGVVLAALELSDVPKEREELQNAFEKLYFKLRDTVLCKAASAELEATHTLVTMLLKPALS